MYLHNILISAFHIPDDEHHVLLEYPLICMNHNSHYVGYFLKYARHYLVLMMKVMTREKRVVCHIQLEKTANSR